MRSLPDPTNGEPTRKRRMPRADRERQMMAVAEQVFAERGYVAASMDEIADRVGVSKPMLYEYFGSKEGLLVACIRLARAELLQVTSDACVRPDTPEQMLRQGLIAYFRFITEHQKSWALLRSEAAVVGPSAAGEIEAVRQQQTDLISSTMALYAPAPLDTAPVAEVIVGGCERLALWCERNQDVTPEQAAELVMQLIWFGIAAVVPDTPSPGRG
ncbi:MAG TPA: TetR/AcrR family transcriptional regulator [Pseudonocardiaceae bacterium]|jgi:AcrR family transcriptional regulator|nr:TetR/AcrR family transcriptional regulator [Pseudonocardiaceae bacterium]